jgi:hypothetical protein
VKVRVAESGKWVCDKCITERLRILEEKLQDALHRIDTLTGKNKSLEEKLRLATEGRKVGSSENVKRKKKSGECLVLGDSIICNVGIECPDIKVGCFPGIRTEQLQRVIEKRTLETQTQLSSM